MMHYFIETKRLLLRQWKPSDRHVMLSMGKDERVMRYYPALLTENETDTLIEKIACHFKQYGYGLYALEIKETGEFIGYTGLLEVGFEAHFTPAMEIGWRLAAEHWGQGYATEAAKAVLHYGFNSFELDEIVSFTAAINKPSERVMQKIGMIHHPEDDFDHPRLPKSSPLSRHILYRITRNQGSH